MGGNCVYRRSALHQIGGFPAGAFSEDIEVSLALVAAGWSTRFCRDAVAESRVVESLRRYWNQRCRWTRGLYRSRKRASRLESWLVSAGYADRLVFAAALVLAVSGHLSVLWPALYSVAPMTAAASALYRAGLGPALTARVLLSIPPMFAVDVAVHRSGNGQRCAWTAAAVAHGRDFKVTFGPDVAAERMLPIRRGPTNTVPAPTTALPSGTGEGMSGSESSSPRSR